LKDRLAAKAIHFRRQPLNHPRFCLAKALAELGIRDEASLFLELCRVDFAARETQLKDLQRVGCCGVGLVFVRRPTFATALAAMATVAGIFAAALAFNFGLRLSFLHYLSPVMPDLVRLDVALDLRNAVGFRRN
jgi:hypothetical protein